MPSSGSPPALQTTSADQPAIAPMIACDLAELLVSGLSGLSLMGELHARFGRATRTDVFFGVAMALSLLEAERIALLYELKVAEGRQTPDNSKRSDGR